jgi:hypothetical protein
MGGENAVGGSRTTKWLIEDTCAGTLVKVAEGVVAVENLHSHRTVLVRAGHSLLTRPTGRPEPVAPSQPGAPGVGEFLTPRALGVECGIADRPGYAGVNCQTFARQPKPYQQKATIDANGRVAICRERSTRNELCKLGNRGEGKVPTFGYGQHLAFGRFRCDVLHEGVRCVYVTTGKGFLINNRRASAIG